jgi:hypothetical protein
MRCGLLCGHPFKQSEHCWTVPCFTLKGATKLIRDAIHFRDGSLFHWRHRFTSSGFLILQFPTIA